MAPSSGPQRQNRPQERGGVFSAQHFLPVDAAHSASQSDALQALLAFSALHEQIRRRKALAPKASSRGIFEAAPPAEFEATELFLLDEVLQLVAERAIAITGADGLAIALAENNEIVLRAAAGVVRPDIGARIDRDSAFSGACFRTAQVINCFYRPYVAELKLAERAVREIDPEFAYRREYPDPRTLVDYAGVLKRKLRGRYNVFPDDYFPDEAAGNRG